MLALNEKSQANFDRLVDGFIEKYDNLFLQFPSYFEPNDFNRCQLWAMCYRNFPHGKKTQTCMLKFSTIDLKHFTWIGNLLDALLNMLLKIE